MTATLKTNEAIVSHLGKRRRKRDWRHLFGDLFPVLEDALCNTGNPVRHVSCDFCNCNHVVRPANSDYVAVCQCTEEPCDDIPLSATEAEAWEFNAIEFAKKIAKSLSLQGGVHSCGDGVIDLGQCPKSKGKKHAILCTCNTQHTSKSLSAITQLKEAGCVLSFGAHEALSPAVKNLGAALLTSDHVTIHTSNGVACRCDQACQHIASNEPVTQGHFDARMNRLEKTYTETKEDAEKAREELAAGLLGVLKKADPNYIQSALCVLAAGSERKAAKKLGIPNSTFAKYLADHKNDNSAHRAINAVLKKRFETIGKRSIERFNEEWEEHQPAINTGGDDLQELLETIIEGLEGLNPQNALAIRKELLDICKPFGQNSGHS